MAEFSDAESGDHKTDSANPANAKVTNFIQTVEPKANQTENVFKSLCCLKQNRYPQTDRKDVKDI